jgi:hypothetical protein
MPRILDASITSSSLLCKESCVFICGLVPAQATLIRVAGTRPESRFLGARPLHNRLNNGGRR